MIFPLLVETLCTIQVSYMTNLVGPYDININNILFIDPTKIQNCFIVSILNKYFIGGEIYIFSTKCKDTTKGFFCSSFIT
jgi:hypothetical protein